MVAKWSLTISDQYVLINEGFRKDWELWQLNSTNSVRIQLPEYELYFTDAEKEMFRNDDYFSYWLLDPSSTPRYLVYIVNRELTGTHESVLVLVFDQLNDPQFLHRLVLPAGESWIYRLFTTKGIEQTALVMKNDDCVYISDLVNDFKEIKGCNIDRYIIYQPNCRSVRGDMYQTYWDDSYHLNVSFDGERFLFNETKVEKFYVDFKREETTSCCLPYHMAGESQSKFHREYYYPLMSATDTILLWRSRSPQECKNQNCPIRDGFYIFVEQDFLINSGKTLFFNLGF